MLKNILKGIQAYAGTFSLINKLGLWKYFAVPMAISFFTALAIGFSAWGLSDNLGAFISKIWFWEWGSETFRTISEFIGALIIIAFGLIIYRHIVMALSAPFMSPVSEKIEKYLFGENHSHRKTSNAEQLWRGVRINVRNLLMELMLTIPIILIGFIPVIGIVSSVLLFLVQSYYAGFGNMDYTLERHYKYSESIQFVRRNRGLAIGNGIVFMLMLLIPVVGIILVLPLSVTAASTETLKVLEKAKSVQKKL
ncbi:EI24 domain-containing protein [Aequorivita lipolytica]|uniref:EI24 domain-containing protein n=1 Tax=Aequorivita lipolytica TaxID=153267 RepID=A0A5C6YTV7_9FLAO|nr:EI24 domain-containing protein [Aequorivita lipolytica]TXD70403.1 EI24 domain-containing protein [Aequorivita lipolytica]SRX50833.1 Sulfate transporter CysZ [Aequorivita lipolytica]